MRIQRIVPRKRHVFCRVRSLFGKKEKAFPWRGDVIEWEKRECAMIEYGWNSTVFTTVEQFWAERGVSLPNPDGEESYEKIRRQILRLNPGAEEKNIRKFIRGK